jgi:hypothetical protein
MGIGKKWRRRNEGRRRNRRERIQLFCYCVVFQKANGKAEDATYEHRRAMYTSKEKKNTKWRYLLHDRESRMSRGDSWRETRSFKRASTKCRDQNKGVQ